MAKRILLFMSVNLLILVTLSLVLNLLGFRGYIAARGIDYGALMAFCLFWGMGGAFISLAMSRKMAKWMMRVQVIDPARATGDEAWLVQTVHRLARAADLPEMPEVGIYNSPEVNAFATGPTKSRALVAVSTGLLSRMDPQAVEGVLGHEIAHVANGDMVTMTLLQGVVNAFVMFFARILAFAITQALANNQRNERGGGAPSYMMHHMITMVLEMVFGLLGMVVVAWFSRWREFRADAGGARLAGREKMVNALEALRRSIGLVDPRQTSVSTLKISGKPQGLAVLFASHPPLEERIRRLQRMGA